MLKLFKFLRVRDWILLLVILGLVFLSVYLDLRIPDFMADITTYLQESNSSIGDIWIAGAKMLGCALGSAVVSVVMGGLSSYIASNLSKTLRKELYLKVERMSLRDIEHFSTASLITRTTNDVSQIQNIFSMGLSILLKAPVMYAQPASANNVKTMESLMQVLMGFLKRAKQRLTLIFPVI